MPADNRAIRLYLIEDHTLVREAFAAALSSDPGIDVVGTAGEGSAALTECPRLDPDVILVDLGLPDRDGTDLMAALRSRVPRAKLLVLSAHRDTPRVAAALRAGANGYVTKTRGIEELFDAVKRVSRGETVLSPEVASAAVSTVTARDVGSVNSLSPRELQVLQHLAEGLSTREVAARLCISPKTIETHRVRIYAKLGVSSPVELTRFAIREGLVAA